MWYIIVLFIFAVQEVDAEAMLYHFPFTSLHTHAQSALHSAVVFWWCCSHMWIYRRWVLMMIPRLLSRKLYWGEVGLIDSFCNLFICFTHWNLFQIFWRFYRCKHLKCWKSVKKWQELLQGVWYFPFLGHSVCLQLQSDMSRYYESLQCRS